MLDDEDPSNVKWRDVRRHEGGDDSARRLRDWDVEVRKGLAAHSAASKKALRGVLDTVTELAHEGAPVDEHALTQIADLIKTAFDGVSAEDFTHILCGFLDYEHLTMPSIVRAIKRDQKNSKARNRFALERLFVAEAINSDAAIEEAKARSATRADVNDSMDALLRKLVDVGASPEAMAAAAEHSVDVRRALEKEEESSQNTYASFFPCVLRQLRKDVSRGEMLGRSIEKKLKRARE